MIVQMVEISINMAYKNQSDNSDQCHIMKFILGQILS